MKISALCLNQCTVSQSTNNTEYFKMGLSHFFHDCGTNIASNVTPVCRTELRRMCTCAQVERGTSGFVHSGKSGCTTVVYETYSFNI